MSSTEALPTVSLVSGSDRSVFSPECSHQPNIYDADLQHEYHFPELAPWGPLLDRLEVPRLSRIELAGQARVSGATFLQQLAVSGLVKEEALHRALAGELGVE